MVLTIVERRAATLLVGALASIGTACDLDSARDNGASPVLGAGITDEIDALAIVDPQIRDKVDDCIESARLKIFAGDAHWQQVWLEGGESVLGLRTHCERLAKHDPSEFAAIHAEWTAWEQSIGASP